MIVYAFCPQCLGVFESRAFDMRGSSGGSVSNCAETCVFCGSTACAESDPNNLKPIILDALHEKMMASADVKAVQSILRKLERGSIPLSVAETEIESISPGLGKRIVGAIRKHGGAAIVTFIAAFGLYAQFQMVGAAREANEISRQALKHAVEASKQVDSSSESQPSDGKIDNPHPRRTVHKNRKTRRAENAKERRKK
ncbi:hypothetical protein [Roseovarius nanhaiticus]|uniref:hypothetical protein n=1 Tax=Roseovarius nanhaiticus TaxID=573024 RepID=UPI00249115D8|nr:hypothetical protein [Roseovarius nanhaiticus]